MRRLPLQLSVLALMVLVAGLAVNLWLFRFGMLAGILGLSVTKHLAIAWLCQVLGVNRRLVAAPAGAVGPPPAEPASTPLAVRR